MKGLNTQRANTATRTCHNCSAVFGLPNTDLVEPEERKAKFRGRSGWVPNGSGGYILECRCQHRSQGLLREIRAIKDFSQPAPDGVSA
jgi:hypothetical protein